VRLRFPLEFSFSTVQSSISYAGIQTQPFHGDVGVDPMTNSILVTFPRRMDPSTTEAAVSIKPSQEFFFLWPEKNILKIYTGAPLLADTALFHASTDTGTARRLHQDSVVFNHTVDQIVCPSACACFVPFSPSGALYRVEVQERRNHELLKT